MVVSLAFGGDRGDLGGAGGAGRARQQLLPPGPAGDRERYLVWPFWTWSAV